MRGKHPPKEARGVRSTAPCIRHSEWREKDRLMIRKRPAVKCGFPLGFPAAFLASRHTTPLAADGSPRQSKILPVARAHSPGWDDEGAGREAGAEEVSVHNRDRGRAAGVLPVCDAPCSRCQMQPASPGVVGPLGHDNNRWGVFTPEYFQGILTSSALAYHSRRASGP